MADTATLGFVARFVDRAAAPMAQLERRYTRMTKKVTGLSTVMIQQRAVFRNAMLGITLPIVGLAGVLVKTASDAEETASKFSVVFSSLKTEAESMATNLKKNFGLSSLEAKTLLSDTGDLLTGFGFSQKAALDLSGQVQTLAVDLASFTNFAGGAEGASKALTKALLGEREMVKSLGISILEADVKARVALNTQRGMTFESNRQAKAFATLQLAQEQSKNAMGDFARTSQGFANQFRILRGKTIDMAVSFGNLLLPIALKMVKAMGKLVDMFEKMPKSVKITILVLGALAATIPPILFVASLMIGAFVKFGGVLRQSVIRLRAYNIEAIRTAAANRALAASTPNRILPQRNALGRFTKIAPGATKGKGLLSGIFGNTGKAFSGLGKTIGKFVKGIGGKLLAPLAIVLGVFSLWKKNIFGVRDAFASMIAFIRDRVIKPIKFWFTFIKVILQALFTRSVSAADAEFLGDKFGLVIDILNNPFVKAIRSIIAFFERLSIAFEKVGASIGTFTSGMLELGGIGAGIGFLFGGPLGAAIGGAIGALIAGIINIVQNWDEFKRLISATWDLVMDSGPVRFIKQLGKTIAKFFAPENNAFVAFIVSVFDFIAGFNKIFAAVVVGLGRFLFRLGGKIWDGIKDGVKRGAIGFFNFLVGFLPDKIPFIDIITEKLTLVREGVKGLWDTVVVNIKKAFGKIPDLFRGALNIMRRLFFSFAAKIQLFLAGAFKAASAITLGGFKVEEAAARAKARTFGLSAARLRGPEGRTDIQQLVKPFLDAATARAREKGPIREGAKIFIDLKGTGLEGNIELLRPLLQEMLNQMKIKGIIELIDTDITSSDEALEG